MPEIRHDAGEGFVAPRARQLSLRFAEGTSADDGRCVRSPGRSGSSSEICPREAEDLPIHSRCAPLDASGVWRGAAAHSATAAGVDLATTAAESLIAIAEDPELPGDAKALDKKREAPIAQPQRLKRRREDGRTGLNRSTTGVSAYPQDAKFVQANSS